MITDESDAFIQCQIITTELAYGIIIAVCQPLQIRLHDTLGVVCNHTVLAYINAMHETKLIRDFFLGTLT